MAIKLLRSIIIGLFVAGLLLSLFPTLRTVAGLQYTSFSLPKFQRAPASYNNAVQSAAPAVVNIYNSSINSTSNNLKINSLGSGVIMNGNGYILTNQHVIENASRIIVTLQTGRTFDAKLIGSDQLTDLAVLKIQANNLPFILINKNRAAKIGDIVLAIGNPFNLGQTVTQGIISATGRIGLSPYVRQNFLQIDASINHGNSGGALVNTLGELIGINTLSLDKGKEGEIPEGIGFAIPTELAVKVMNKLIRDGKVIRGYIGIEPSMSHIQGILVGRVHPKSPAEQAGIQAGDILLNVDNKAANSVLEVMDQVAEIPPGTTIQVEISRRGERVSLNLKIIETPPITASP